MKSATPVRAFGRAIVGALPQPMAEMLRGVKRAVINRRGSAAVFRDIYVNNEWDGTESVSGPGSTLAATENVRAVLPGLLSELGVETLLDVPCGDAHWITTCLPAGVRYIGGDVVPDIVDRNQKVRSHLGTFEVIDLVNDRLPAADLILVRDCFIHLPNHMILQAISNIRRADIGYMLTTTFPHETANGDIELGGYRPVNLTAAPFGLRAPGKLILDEDGVRKNGKHLGLWKLR